MTGRVDGDSRTLVRVPLAAVLGGPRTEIEAWVDTAFNGGLTLPRTIAAGLGVNGEAVLADGKLVELESLVYYLDWFGGTY